jgi:RNA polymerase sigma-70 factor (sigma-E family)
LNPEARREFGEFVAARTTSLMRLAYVLTGDQHAAEDLLQSALTKTAGRWRSVHASPEAYVRKAMYHEQVSRWRSPWRRHGTVPEQPVSDRSHEVDLRLSLERALLALPPRKRAVIVLRYYEDLPEHEVARMLGCSVGTVRSQTHKALARLREVAPELGPGLSRPESARRTA